MTICIKTAKHSLFATFVFSLSFSFFARAASFESLNEENNYNIEIEKNLNNNAENAFPGMDNFFNLGRSQTSKSNNKYTSVIKLIKEKKLKNAREKLATLLKQNPNDVQLYNLQALLEIQENNIEAAKENYKKAIEVDPKIIDGYLNLAQIAFSEGQLNQAKKYVNTALTISKNNTYAHLLRAKIALEQKDTITAEKTLLAALKNNKGNLESEAEIISYLGKYYIDEKQPKKLLPLSHDLIKRYPDNPLALSILVSALVANNQIQSAEEALQKYITKHKNDTNNRLTLIRLLSEHPNKGKKINELFDEIYSIEPNNLSALVFETNYLTITKEYKKALEIADKVQSLVPDKSTGKQLKGDIFIAENKLDKALAAYQQAHQIEPTNRTLFKIADLMSAQGKINGSINFLKKELAINDKNIAAHFKLATIYQYQNNSAQAQEHYNAVLAEQPDNVDALNNLAWLYLAQNDSRTLSVAEKAYKNSGEAPAIADTYGYALIKLGKPKEGLKILEKAAKSLPKIQDIQYHLAEAYTINGNNKQAIEILEKIVNSQKSFSEKKQLAGC